MTVYVKDYLSRGYTIEQAITEILRCPENRKNTVIDIPKGHYEIHKTDLPQRLLYISNHDSGIKSIFLDLSKCENVTIEGNGSQFEFVGCIVPVVIDHSANVHIKNFSIDYKRTFFTQGEVIYADHQTVRLKIDRDTYPYRVENNRVTFYGEDYSSDHIHQFTEFDPKTKAPTYGGFDNWFGKNKAQPFANEIDDNILEFRSDFPYLHNKGNIIVIKNERRYIPANFLTDSENIVMQNILVNQCSSMAFICQMCENITLDHCAVLVKKNSGRMLSSNTDASHFVNCTGKILIKDCHFENMLDDGINIHGTYATVRNIFNTTGYLQIGHYQQYGVVPYRPGDIVYILDHETLTCIGHARIKSFDLLNENTIRVQFDENYDIPATGDLIENRDRCPELEVAGCKIGNNRARAVLLQINGKTYLHDNTFYSSGTALMVCCGDHHFWYEAGVTGDIIAEHNHFHYARYAMWGNAVVDIMGREVKPADQPRFHKSVRLFENQFDIFEKPFCLVDDTDYFEFSNNTIHFKPVYPPLGMKNAAINDYHPLAETEGVYTTDHCSQVVVNNNMENT